MGHRLPPIHRQFWFQLSLVVLAIGMSAGPLGAQTIDSAQAPSLNTQTPQIPSTPPPQDVQPPRPTPQIPSTPPPQEDVQPPPQIIQPPRPTLPEPETPSPLPPPEQLIPSPPSTPATPEADPGKVPENITVKRFEVVGSTVFSSEELDKVLVPFTNRRISFAELFQARSAVTQLYIDRGYITSGALIPAQKLDGGVVQIQVVEGGLEAINVTGTRRLKPNYVRSRLRLATSKPLNRERLLEALQLLQLNPLIQNLSAELSAGSSPGTSVLEVRVTEADTFSTQIAIDNNRAPSVGSFRRRVQLNEANLLGLGDGLSVGYANTDGSNDVDASYTLPLNPRNGTLSLSFSNTWSNVIEPPFDILDIKANSRYYDLTFRQPVVQTPRQDFAIGLTASRRESDTSLRPPGFSRIPYDLSPGADNDGRTRISALRFFQEWTQRSSREVLAARSQFSLGIGGVLDSTVNPSEPDSRFFAWRGQGQWVRLLAPETLLLLRADVQLATTSLVPLEQFGLGGQESVRGYRQDALLSDNGVFASAELRYPIYRAPQGQSVLQLAPFVDVGTTWNNSSTIELDSDTLVSVGLGLRWQLGDRLTARLDWGIPLVDIPSRERTWQENGVYFSVIYNPF